MDAIREFGDPDDLIYKEDLVLLKYEDPWPATRPLPVGCAIVEGSSRRLLSTTTTKLVCSRKELENTGITGALFAGCVAFESNSSLSTAAADILARSHTLVLIHNRDMISQLIFCFPGIRLLVLHHDLRMHSEMEWPESHGRDPRIRKIMGDSPGGGADYLYICAEGLSNLATLCPQVGRGTTRGFFHHRIALVGCEVLMMYSVLHGANKETYRIKGNTFDKQHSYLLELPVQQKRKTARYGL